MLFLSLFLWFFSNTFSPLAYAQVKADKNAPKNQQPTVLIAPNGTPLVNIQTPSAEGVSRNTYTQFDVKNNGVILNNSRTSTQSQLGGWVEVNPWLNKNEARIILNEVNSQNPSLLNGFIEVAGQRAEVIIANPAGISVNGGGFINAHQVTLTTGQYGAHDQRLTDLAVREGKILVQGQGLNTLDADYTRLLAQAVEVNSGLWAQDLQVGIGQADYKTDASSIQAISTSDTSAIKQTPQFLLDVAHLGGMYAGKIKLVGTQAGVGVNNQGYIGASAGNLELTIDGQLVNKGQIVATDESSNPVSPSHISIKATDISNQGGTLYTDGSMQISARGNVKTLKKVLLQHSIN